MNWLLVSLEKNESCFDGVKKIISSHDGFISEYSSGSFDNNFYKNVKECDYCVWLCSSEQFLCSGDFAYAAGYLIGKGIPFFCVCDTSKNDIQLVSSDCHFFSKIEQLEKTLSDKFPEILEIEKQKKGVYLLVMDGGIGKNSLKPMLKAKETLGCPLYITDEGVLSEWVHRPAVKAVAILDDNLAVAMLQAADGEPKFKSYSGGNN